MSEAKLAKPKQRASKSRAQAAPAHVHSEQQPATAACINLPSKRWCDNLLRRAAIAVALLSAVYYGKTRLHWQNSEPYSIATSKAS